MGISHVHPCQRLQGAIGLESDGSIDILRDRDDILPAEDWSERLHALILRADAVVVCISPDSAISPEVASEVASALQAHKRILPVVLRDTGDALVAPELRRLNYVYLRDGDPYDERVAALRQATYTEIGWVREHTRLAGLAQRWAHEGRRGSDTLRGAALESAERWLATRPRDAPEPTTLPVEYIGSSRRDATQRLRLWVAAACVVAAVSLGLSALAAWQRHEAITQRTSTQAARLIAEAQAVLADPLAPGETAVQDLLTSLALRPSDEARRTMTRAVDRLEPTRVAALPWPAQAGTQIKDLRFSPDGNRLLLVTDRAIVAWLCASGEMEWWRPAAIDEPGAQVVFAHDGRHALVIIGDSPDDATQLRALLVDLAAGSVTEPSHGRLHDAAARRDGLMLLAQGADAAGLVAIDAVSGKARWRTALRAPVQRARLVVRVAGPPGIPGPTHDVVAVDAAGELGLWTFDSPESAHSLSLPKGAHVTLIGQRGVTLALLLGDGRAAVIEVSGGRELWHSTTSTGAVADFTGGDRYAIVVDGQDGLQMVDVFGGTKVQIDRTRHTDWDVTAMGRVERYTPIVDARASDDGSILATAAKDGRVLVWRPGYGLHFGMPGPTLDVVGQFDHGETLGPTVTWTAPPALALSASGRYVASQGTGLKTNSVGGPTEYDPKLRIWDTRTGGEIARFHRHAAMQLVFAPLGELAATLTAPAPASADTVELAPTLELWRLGPPQPALEQRRDLVVVATPSALPLPAGASSAVAVWFMPATQLYAALTERVWLGLDRKLRLFDPLQRKVVVLDDLAPAMRQQQERVRAAAAASRANEKRGSDDAQGAPLPADPEVVDMATWLSRINPGAPAASPLPTLPIAVSGDGRRADVKIGPQLRVYALDRRAWISSIDGADESTSLDPSGTIVLPTLMMSRNARYVAASRVDAATVRELQRALNARAASPAGAGGGAAPIVVRRDIVVFDLEGHDAPALLREDVALGTVPSPSAPYTTASRALALSDDGALLALEQRRLVGAEGPLPAAQARVIVLETRSGRVQLETPFEPLPSPMDPFRQAVDPPWTAAFSPSGGWLVTDQSRASCPAVAAGMVFALIAPPITPCSNSVTQLKLWSLHDGRLRGGVSYERGPTLTKEASRALLFAASLRVGANLQLDDDRTVVRSLIEWGTAQSDQVPAPIALEITEERIPLQQPDPLETSACMRLPPALRSVGATQWAKRLPGESTRAICGV